MERIRFKKEGFDINSFRDRGEKVDREEEDKGEKRGTAVEKEKSSNWQEKEEEIMFTLRRRVENGKRLKEITEAISLEDSSENVERILRDHFKSVLFSFSEETVSNFEKIKRLKEEEKNIELVIENRKEEEIGEEEKLRISLDKSRIQEEIKNLLEDPDVEFLSNFELIISNLINKNRYIKELLEEGETKAHDMAISDLTKKVDNLRGEDVDFVVFEPFSIIFDIRKLEKSGKNINTLGRYLPGTSFICIYKERGKITVGDRKLDIEHERIHNLLDGTIDSPSKSTDFVTTLSKIDQDSGDFLVSKRKIIDTDHREMIDEQKEEIVAGMDGFRESIDILEDSEIDEAVFGNDFKDKDFYKISNFFSTVGIDIRDVSIFIEFEVEKQEDLELKEFLIDFNERLKKEFVKVGESIRESDKFTDTLGAKKEEAKKDAEILFLLLKPTQYRHIVSYLKYFYKQENR